MDFIRAIDVIIHDKAWIPNDGILPVGVKILHIFGRISCGDFKLIDCEVEGYLEIPEHMLGNDEYFVLKASGDSMIEAGINDGDLVIVQKNTVPEDGDIAVVMMGEEVTLKKFFRLPKENKYLLKPENKTYKDIIVDKCNIIGIAVKIIKNI